MKRLFTIVTFAIALFSPCAQSKCVTAWYEVAGTISESNGAAIPNAEVLAVWSELSGQSRQTLSGRSATNGSYMIRVPFYTGTGANHFGRDVCTATLAQVSISVAANGYDSASSNVVVNSSQVTANYSLKRTAGVGVR